jgi:hypothetical protein
MALPTCAPTGPGFNAYSVPVTIPAGTPLGVYCVRGKATVTFSDGITITATGDQVVCLVEEAPGQPGKPRLGIELLTDPFPRCAPGDQFIARYKITNNDPNKSVKLTAFADSNQIAIRPQGANETQGVFAIANPFGDDFPIAFNPENCIPLPDHPFTQGEISKRIKKIKPGRSTIIEVGIRSFGACGTGSCSESTLRVEGKFSDDRPALACAGMALYIDTSVPSKNCGSAVNDCNRNGVPDAEDIARGTSQDRNFNAVPDECELGPPIILGPVEVTPIIVRPGDPIHVQVRAQDDRGVSAVFADGVMLTTRDGQVWEGDIPSSREAGPQTVFAIAVDGNRNLATHIGVYNTGQNEDYDFRISASRLQRVEPGGSARSNVTVYNLGRFIGHVGLSVEGLPPGASASFSPNSAFLSIGEWFDSVMTVATNETTPKGTYRLTITAARYGTAMTRETTVMLVVEGPEEFGFNLHTFDTPQTVAPGGTAQFRVAVTLVSGQAELVALGIASELPPGMVTGFSTNPVTPTGDGGTPTSLTVETNRTTPPGTYVLIIEGRSGEIRRVATVTLIVESR